jgi:hypothetical protein
MANWELEIFVRGARPNIPNGQGIIPIEAVPGEDFVRLHGRIAQALQNDNIGELNFFDNRMLIYMLSASTAYPNDVRSLARWFRGGQRPVSFYACNGLRSGTQQLEQRLRPLGHLLMPCRITVNDDQGTFIDLAF